jgi:GNAT superfamily N-acetyltransferase
MALSGKELCVVISSMGMRLSLTSQPVSMLKSIEVWTVRRSLKDIKVNLMFFRNSPITRKDHHSFGDIKGLLMDTAIAVHPSMQGKRVGQRLFEQFLLQVPSHICRVELYTWKTNQRNVKFYQVAGTS